MIEQKGVGEFRRALSAIARRGIFFLSRWKDHREITATPGFDPASKIVT